jgi:hypothetical protein
MINYQKTYHVSVLVTQASFREKYETNVQTQKKNDQLKKRLEEKFACESLNKLSQPILFLRLIELNYI